MIFLRHGIVVGCGNHARGDAVDGDSVWGEGYGEGMGEGEDGTLGGGVDVVAWEAERLPIGADVDDAAVGQRVGDWGSEASHLLRADEDGPDIGGHGDVELLDRGIEERALLFYGDIVDDDVHPTPLIGHLADEVAEGVGIGDIDVEEIGAGAEGCLLPCGIVDIAESDLVASCSECADDGHADALGTARDDGSPLAEGLMAFYGLRGGVEMLLEFLFKIVVSHRKMATLGRGRRHEKVLERGHAVGCVAVCVEIRRNR